MAVDSDEEVDYSKMDQVWSWKDGWGQLLFSAYPLLSSQMICFISWASSSFSCSNRNSSIVGSWAA